MVGLDLRRLGFRVRCALDHVRVERALRQQLRVAHRVPEDVDEQVADDHALLLRVVHPVEGCQETLAAINRLDRHAHAVEIVAHLLALVLPHQAVIDEDRAHVGTRLVQQHGEHGAVHAARNPADNLLVADLFADAVDDLAFQVVDAERQQVFRLEQEIVQDPQSFVAVGDFRVELDAEEAVVPLEGDRRAVLVGGDHPGALGQDFHRVRVAHPDLRLRRDAFVEPLALGGEKIRRAVFAARAGLHGAAELDVEQLHAVAHAQHRHVEFLQRGEIQIRRVRLAGALRSAGQDDRAGTADVREILDCI